MARDKKPIPGERLTGTAAFREVVKGVAERNEAAHKAARSLRQTADAKKLREMRARELD